MVAQDLQFFVPGEFPIVRCARCGLVYLSPQPSAAVLVRHYPPRYFEVYTSAAERLIAEGRVREDGYVRRLSRLSVMRTLESRTGRTVLDIGCGCGLFLFSMASSGWRVAGLEPSEQAVAFATQRLGLDQIGRGDVTSADFSGEQFDLVTMWHVLEHVADPLDTLRRLHPWLRSDGLLAVCVPNIQSLQARVFRRYWFHLDVPRHLVHYSPVTLQFLLGRAGFEIVERELGCDNTTGWHNSLRRLVFVGLRSVLRRRCRPAAILSTAAGWDCPGTAEGRPRGTPSPTYALAYTAFHRGLASVLRPFAFVLGQIEGALGHHAEVLVLARKSSGANSRYPVQRRA
jgi:SAM-dependent methyltransferase